MTDTVTNRELSELVPSQLLHRLYHQEQVTLYPSRPLHFHCGCSRDKIEAVLIQLGQVEIEQVALQEGRVSVECEFCNRTYEFDAVDISTLFMATNQPPSLHQ
jgi:molecular chaperone Hsp33